MTTTRKCVLLIGVAVAVVVVVVVDVGARALCIVHDVWACVRASEHTMHL